jgi:hypothetical protein
MLSKLIAGIGRITAAGLIVATMSLGITGVSGVAQAAGADCYVVAGENFSTHPDGAVIDFNPSTFVHDGKYVCVDGAWKAPCTNPATQVSFLHGTSYTSGGKTYTCNNGIWKISSGTQLPSLNQGSGLPEKIGRDPGRGILGR